MVMMTVFTSTQLLSFTSIPTCTKYRRVNRILRLNSSFVFGVYIMWTIKQGRSTITAAVDTDDAEADDVR